MRIFVILNMLTLNAELQRIKCWHTCAPTLATRKCG